MLKNERKVKKRVRRRAIVGNDVLLSVQEGQNRVQQLDTEVNSQIDEPTLEEVALINSYLFN